MNWWPFLFCAHVLAKGDAYICNESITFINMTDRFESKQFGLYQARDCCFQCLSNAEEYGGAIYIDTSNCSLCISISTFFKCSSLEGGGGIYYRGGIFNFTRSFGKFCSLTNVVSDGIFLFAQMNHGPCQFKGISVFECSNETCPIGENTLFLQFFTGSISDLNFSHNCISQIDMSCNEFMTMSNFTICFSLFALCPKYIMSFMMTFGMCKYGIMSSSSFINNSFCDSYETGVIKAEFTINFTVSQCIFSNNSLVKSICISGEGNIITFERCFISNSGNLSSLSYTVDSIEYKNKDAYTLNGKLIDLCPTSFLSESQLSTNEKTKSSGLEPIAVVGICLMVGSFVAAIVIITYKIHIKNSHDARRLREFELTESISKEFG